MHEWIVIQSEDKNTGFGMNCPCNSFTTEVILSIVQMFDKGVDAKCSECESYLCTQVVHLYMKLPCESERANATILMYIRNVSALRDRLCVDISMFSTTLGPFHATLRGVCMYSLPVMEETSFSWVASQVCGELCSTQEPEPDQWYKTITVIYDHIILICLSVGVYQVSVTIYIFF